MKIEGKAYKHFMIITPKLQATKQNYIVDFPTDQKVSHTRNGKQLENKRDQSEESIWKSNI